MNIEKIQKEITELKNIAVPPVNTGWMYDQVALFVYSLVKLYKPDTIIQTGHLWGKSAIICLNALTDDNFQDLNGDFEPEKQVSDKAFNAFVESKYPQTEDVKFISIDPYMQPKHVAHFHQPQNIDGGIEYIKSIYKDKFVFHKESSHEWFKNNDITTLGNRIVAVVDGDHTYQGCMQDLLNLNKPNVHCIIVDDVSFLPYLHDCCVEFSQNTGWKYVRLDAFNGIGVLSR